jgi:hypothetical protein
MPLTILSLILKPYNKDMIHYTKQYLTKLENLFEQGGFLLRYEKGNFKSGYCLLENNKVIVVNKFASMDNKINILVEIVGALEFNMQLLDDKMSAFYNEISQREIKL